MQIALFENRKTVSEDQQQTEDSMKLIMIQANALVSTYHTTQFDVKLLQEVLGIGEKKAYTLLREGKIDCPRGGKKYIVSVAALARYMVLGPKQ